MKLALFLVIILGYSCSNPTHKDVKTTDIPLGDILLKRKIKPQDISIVISKTDYLLHLVNGTDTVKSYPVALGANPIDPKLIEGDKCTPEGSFKARDKYPHKSWTKFIWIDYPNEVSQANFNEAKARGIIPQSATIGGEVGIHGVPLGRNDLIENKTNWTLGCISVTTEVINEIYSVVDNNTRIQINH